MQNKKNIFCQEKILDKKNLFGYDSKGDSIWKNL